MAGRGFGLTGAGLAGPALAGLSLLAIGPAMAQAEETRRTGQPGSEAYAQLRPAPAAATVTLDEVVVQGTGAGQPPATGTVGQPPVPYAGGQVGSGTRLGFLGNRSIFDTPFNITGYTEKLMRDQQARSVADAVLNDPSVRNDAPAFSERDSYFIRGFSVTNLDTAFDGLFYIANPRRSFLEGIERVEILKGPSALLNGGTGRVGGTINLIPKRAGDDPLTRVTTTYLSDSQLWTHVDLGRRFGANKEWGVRFNGSYRQGDTALDKNEVEVGVATLGLDYRSDRFRASLDFSHSTQNITAPTSLFNAVAPGIAIPRAPNGRINTASPLEYIDSRHNMIAARVEYDILPDTTLYAAGGASRYNEDFLTSSFRVTNANGQATNSLAIQPQEIRGFTGEAGVRSRFRTGFVGHELTVAASRAVNENYRGGFNAIALPSFTTNIYNPIYLSRNAVATFAFPRSGGRPLFADLDARSLAVADTLSVLDGRLQLTLGGRYQSILQKGYDTRPLPSQGQVTSRYDEGRFSPAVAVVVRPTEKLSLYGNYVEALEVGPTAPAVAVNAGEIFAPTVSKQVEVGAKYDFGAFAVTASLFDIRQPNGFTDPATNRFSVSGRQANRGLELTVFGEPIEGLRLLGGVTFLDAELVETAGGRFDGNTAPGVPRTMVNLYAEYDLPGFAQGLTVTGRMLYSGSTFYDQANTQRVPDWTRFDVGLRYAFTGPLGKPIVLRANVENVFDEAYWASSARGFLAAGAPRTVVVSAQFDF